MSILYDDEYHREAYEACRQAHFYDGLSYGDILEAQGLKRHKVRPDAALNTLAIVIADSLRNQPEFGWIDDDDRTAVFDNVVYIEPIDEAYTFHGVPNGRMGGGRG